MLHERDAAIPKSDDSLFGEFEPAARDDWIAAIERSLGGGTLRQLHTTADGMDISPVATVEDLDGIQHLDSQPGQYPYLRGTTTTGYLDQPWLIAGEIDIAAAAAWNRELKAAQKGGQRAVYIGAAPTLETVVDIKLALAEIDLARTPLLLAGDEGALKVANLLHAAGMTSVNGCLGYDPLAGLARRGWMRANAVERMARHARLLQSESPKLGSIAVRTHAYHDVGAGPALELGCGLATGVAYMREMLARGLALDQVARSTHFFVSIGENFFVEIAKLRALRRLWARTIEVFGGGDKAQRLTLHAVTGRRDKSLLDAHTNLLRATIEALAAVIGGVDSLLVAPFDAPRGQADLASRRLALNIQHMLAHEVGLTRLVDPAGGSWHVERLSERIAQDAWREFQSIEAAGGMLAALEAGVIQARLAESAQGRQAELATGRRRLVGVNRYPNLTEELPQALPTELHCDAMPADACITAERLRPIRWARPWEELRLAAEKHRRKHGHRPRICLTGDDGADLGEARRLLAAGGFAVLDEFDDGVMEIAIDAEIDGLALLRGLKARMANLR